MDVIFPVFQRADCLEQALLHRPADSHRFTGGFHLCRKRVGGKRKFVKREAGHFRHDIIQRRLKTGGRIGKTDLVKIHTDRDFSRYPGDRIPAGLGGQSR